MQILVTGATGVLGRRVLPLLADHGHEVTAVSRDKPDQVRAGGAEPLGLDLFDPGAVTEAVAGSDAVVDLATSLPGTRRMVLPWAWRENDRLRTEAAANVADAAIAAGARYIRESMGFLYADGGDDWIDEEHALDPVSTTRTALDAEAAAGRVTEAGHVGVALRFAQFLGPDSEHTRDRVERAERGIGMFLGDPEGFESRIHLDDAARAVVAALDVPAGVYNVVEDEPLRRREHVERLEELLDRSIWTPPAFLGRLGPAEAVARSLRMDNTKLREASGWEPVHRSTRGAWPAIVEAVRGHGGDRGRVDHDTADVGAAGTGAGEGAEPGV